MCGELASSWLRSAGCVRSWLVVDAPDPAKHDNYRIWLIWPEKANW